LKHLKDAGAENIIAVSPVEIKNHAADYFFSALKCVLGNEECLPAKLEWPESLRNDARRRLAADAGNKRAIIIHPGSGSPAKNWPAEKFALLATKIRGETGFEPLIIGGEADDGAIKSMRSLLPGFHFLVNTPLMDVASILSVAGGFVGNDSGITHLAAALGIPVVALFGPTDPAIWAPRGENVAIIKSLLPSNESLAEIGVEAVFKTLADNTPFFVLKRSPGCS
jgi:heptosyltransferase-2